MQWHGVQERCHLRRRLHRAGGRSQPQPRHGYGVILQVWRNGGAIKVHAILPAGPAAPGNLSVTVGDGYLDIAWDVVTGATGYDVRAKKTGSSSWHSVASNVAGTSHRYTTSETMDYVAVRARNGNGPGNYTELWRGPAHDWLTTVQQNGASAQSAQGQSQLAAPATLTVTRENGRNEKLYVSWSAVSGASGYYVVCSDTGWGNPDGLGWWNCGSTTSATSLTVDKSLRGKLGKRNYLVAVRAVTDNAADASDWKRSEDVRPVDGQLDNLRYSRSGGSITLSWTPNFWTTGYEIDCAVYGQTYTRCATLTSQDDTAATHSVTLSSWTIGSNTYTIDDGATYAIKITSTNQWGDDDMLVPLISPIPNVSNLSAASDTYGQQVTSTLEAAVGFGTGDNSGGYTLHGVTIRFLAPSRTLSLPLTVAIHEESSGNPASSATYTLTRVHGDPKTAGYVTYSCSGACSLSKETTYFLVLSTSSADGYKWDTTDSDNQTNAGISGWTIADGLKQDGSRWTDQTWTGVFRVSATANPSLTASSIGTTTATLTVGGHTGNWYYKHTNTGATCDGPVAAGTSTKALTGLTAGTSYTYSAYSDSTCTTGNLIATAAQFTTPVSVSNLSETASGNNPTNINWTGGGSFRANVANSFRTGSNSSGYTLESVTVKFAATNGTPGALTVAIYAHNTSNLSPTGNTAVATLNGSNPSTADDYTFTCSGSCTLSASTTYWVVMYSASGGYTSNYYSLTWTASNNQTNEPSSEAWQIGDTAKRGSGSSINTVSWNNVSPAEAVKFKVVATPK